MARSRCSRASSSTATPWVKQFGVGLSSAVLLAATLVLMLAPAVLTLMGARAW